MPFPFVLEGKGVVDLDLDLDLDKIFNNSTNDINTSAWYWNNILNFKQKGCLFNSPSASSEPTSVLDSIRARSSPTSSSTLSSSLGGGGGAGGCGGAAESFLPEPVAACPGQDGSIFRWVMGNVEDPSAIRLNHGFNGGFGVVDQEFEGDPLCQIASFGEDSMPTPNPSSRINGGGGGAKLPKNSIFSPFENNLEPIGVNEVQQCSQQALFSEPNPPLCSTEFLINQNQVQTLPNPSLLLPFSRSDMTRDLVLPRQAKRQNVGAFVGFDPSPRVARGPVFDTGQSSAQGIPPQLQLSPGYLQEMPAAMSMKPRDEMGHCQEGIIDHLYKAAELVQTGNPVLAQRILARLNHQLSPNGKPFHMAAFYCMEALQLIINDMNPSKVSSPFGLISKIAAYKSFSEISPVVQFADFTCNQAILEATEGLDRIHIVDFDIGYGGQWASLMQELALKSSGTPLLKITALASSLVDDQIHLGLARDNLIQFARELNIVFEFEILSIDSLNAASWSLPLHLPEDEVITVNLPLSSFSSYQLSPVLVLGFVKQLSPKIVVSVDDGCGWTDLPFPSHVIHALRSFSNLLESLDAINVNFDTLQKIHRFLVQPKMERIITGRYRSAAKAHHWRTLFLSSGLSPLTFSNFNESQAECLVKRTPVQGFNVEKRQSFLVLCWQHRELISASAWTF